MAIASTETLMSLDQWAAIVGVNPFHFHQGYTDVYMPNSGCDNVWYQYDWMDPGKASREQLARCIAQAEQMIAQLVRFWPAPKFIEDEQRPYPKLREVWSLSGEEVVYPSFRGYRKVVPVEYSHFIQGGRRKVDLLKADVPVTYSNEDGDNVAERATITLTTTLSDLQADEVAVFFDSDTRPVRQIRGLYTRISGNTVTITGWAPQFTNPDLWEVPEAINWSEGAAGVPTVDVYRVWTCSEGEDYAPVEFEWKDVTCQESATGYGFLEAHDATKGLVTPIPAEWDADNEEWQRRWFSSRHEPDKMRLYYLAGWALAPNGQVRAPFDRAIAALSTSLLTEPACGCGGEERRIDQWRYLPTRDDRISFRQMECPWGKAMGAWEAFQMLSRFFGGVGAFSW